MTDDTPESNKACSEDYTLGESMLHIPSLEISHNTKGIFWVCPLGGFFLAYQLGLLKFGFYLLVLNFCLSNSVVGNLSHLILTLSILDIKCKNIPPNISMIDDSKKRLVKNPSGGFFTFCKISVYGMEFFRCVLHVILSRIYLTLLPSG